MLCRYFRWTENKLGLECSPGQKGQIKSHWCVQGGLLAIGELMRSVLLLCEGSMLMNGTPSGSSSEAGPPPASPSAISLAVYHTV